jgi:hypothetical protein
MQEISIVKARLEAPHKMGHVIVETMIVYRLSSLTYYERTH